MLKDFSVQLLLMLALIGHSGSRCVGDPQLPQSKPTSREGEEPNSQALRTINALIQGGNLMLSSDDRLSKHFHCLVRVAFATEGGVQGTHYVVERDGDRVGILALADDGAPFCYMTNGFIAAFDTKRRGTILVGEHGSPSFAVQSDPKTTMWSCDVSFYSRADRPRAIVDIPSMLQACVSNAKGAKWNPKTRTAQITTPHAMASVEVAPEQAPATFPIKSMALRTLAGDSLAIGSIGIDSSAAVNLFGISKKEIQDAGLQVREISAEETSHMQVISPEQFGKDEQERIAAQRFFTLFKRKN